MSRLIDQLGDDPDSAVTLVVDGKTKNFDFLDIILYNEKEYAVLAPPGSEFVEIYLIEDCGSENEAYSRVKNAETEEKIFEIFKLKNEDEFDF